MKCAKSMFSTLYLSCFNCVFLLNSGWNFNQQLRNITNTKPKNFVHFRKVLIWMCQSLRLNNWNMDEFYSPILKFSFHVCVIENWEKFCVQCKSSTTNWIRKKESGERRRCHGISGVHIFNGDERKNV